MNLETKDFKFFSIFQNIFTLKANYKIYSSIYKRNTVKQPQFIKSKVFSDFTIFAFTKSQKFKRVTLQLIMYIELDDFQQGHPLLVKANSQLGEKIKALKANKNYKGIIQLTKTLPSNKDKYLIMANAYMHLNKWKELADACERGLELAEQAQAGDFYNLRGKAMGKLGKYEQKILLCLKAVTSNPKVAAYHRNLGAAYYKLKNYTKAIQSHSKAIQIEPKSSINYHNKAAVFYRLNQHQEALKYFIKATQSQNARVISFIWVADLYKKAKNYQGAKEYFEKAYQISKDPDLKQSAKEMGEKLNPNKKKGILQKLFGF